MENENIGVNIPIDKGDVEHEKVVKLVRKFVKHCTKLDANPCEIGAAISFLQDQYFKVYEALPISRDTIATIRNSRMYEVKEG